MNALPGQVLFFSVKLYDFLNQSLFLLNVVACV